MTLEEIKEATLQLIKQNYEKTGKSSSLKYLYKKINGLNNRSFFKIFKGVEQAHELAGVPYDKSRGEKMKKVRKKRDTKSAKRDKKVDDNSKVALMDPSTSLQLSKDVVQCLYNMQGVMGAPSIDGAIKQAYRDAVSTAKLRVTHWPIYAHDGEEFTTEAMIQKLLGYIDYLDSDSRELAKSLTEALEESEKQKKLAEERYEEGVERGKRDNAIFVRCAYCDEPYQVTQQSEAHAAITQFLLVNGWGHSSCVDKDEYRRSYGSRALDAVLRS